VAIACGRLVTESGITLATSTTPQALLLFFLALSWHVWFPYLYGAVILALGLSSLARTEGLSKQGLYRVVRLAPVFIAVPIAVFGTDHFTDAKIVAAMVPPWLPGHMFWAYFVGVCLLAAALSIASGKHVWLASALFGCMICLFVLLIHIHNIFIEPHNRILWVVALRDTAFAGGAFALSAQKGAWSSIARDRMRTFARLSLGAAIMVFGIQQFLHPELLSGVPLEQSTPLWIPGRLLWSYLTGVIFVAAGATMIVNRKVCLAATAAGLMTLLLVIVVYVPLLFSVPTDIGNGLNYVADTMLLCGSLLALAGAAQD
jgi:uncharacterized membrane protein